MKLTIDIPDDLADALIAQGHHLRDYDYGAPTLRAGIAVAKAVHAQRPEPAAGQVWRSESGGTLVTISEVTEDGIVCRYYYGELLAASVCPLDDWRRNYSFVSAPDIDGGDQ